MRACSRARPAKVATVLATGVVQEKPPPPPHQPRETTGKSISSALPPHWKHRFLASRSFHHFQFFFFFLFSFFFNSMPLFSRGDSMKSSLINLSMTNEFHVSSNLPALSSRECFNTLRKLIKIGFVFSFRVNLL